MTRAESSGAMTALAMMLAFGTGAVDVTCFTRLGAVFASVITGNVVLLGLSATRGSPDLLTHTALSIGGYVTGAACGARIAPREESPHRVPAPRAVVALLVEILVLLVFTAGWEAAGVRPAGAAQFVLLALAAVAMGLQSAAARSIGTPLATTYLTGALTAAVAALTTGRLADVDRRNLASLAAAALGAAAGGGILAAVPRLLPFVPLVALVAGVITARVAEMSA